MYRGMSPPKEATPLDDPARHNLELDVLRIISRLLAERSGQQELLGEALAVLETKLDMRRATVMLLSADGEELIVEATRCGDSRAATCGIDAVHISLPTSPIHLRAMGRSGSWALDQIHETVTCARDHFDYVSVGAQDASRADGEFLKQCVAAACAARVHRIRWADTVGLWTPFQTYKALLELRAAAGDVDIGLHAHNDLGMATANSLAALEVGADSIDVTVCGIGERAGNAPLEEVAMAARTALAMDLQLDIRRRRELCHLVADIANVEIAPGKPVVGRNAFRHESGIHVRGMLADPRCYQPFAAAEVGRAGHEFVIGKHSGTAALRHALALEGITLDRDAAAGLLPAVRTAANRVKRTLTATELVSLYNASVANC
jgi:homocitrate synthase NifV